jgi:TolB-like protein
MTDALKKTGAFEVFDRTSLGEILKEHELGMSGLLDKEKIVKIGKISGVQALVTGSVSKSKNVTLIAKLIDTETAKIIDTAAGQASSFDALAPGMYSLAMELAKE